MARETKQKAQNSSKQRLRTGLLMLQILLPFGLYAAMQMDARLPAVLIAGAFVLCMTVMVWVG